MPDDGPLRVHVNVNVPELTFTSCEGMSLNVPHNCESVPIARAGPTLSWSALRFVTILDGWFVRACGDLGRTAELLAPHKDSHLRHAFF
jgi:hypothetical protein